MSMKTREITGAQLRQLYVYDAGTGTFTSVRRPKAVVGTVTKRGYLRINIGRRPQYAHRLAWLYMHNQWPDEVIDHINGNKLDNRACNLRAVSQQVNAENEREARPNNKSAGLLGVTKCKNSDRYFSRITVHGVVQYIGCFVNPKDAHSAYVAAKRSLHEGCTL